MSESLVDVYIPIREEFDEKEFRDVPVRVLRVPESNGVITIEPERVNFFLKGSKRYLEGLNSEDILAFVDLGTMKKGDYDLPLQIVLPENVSLKDKEPIMIKTRISSAKD